MLTFRCLTVDILKPFRGHRYIFSAAASLLHFLHLTRVGNGVVVFSQSHL